MALGAREIMIVLTEADVQEALGKVGAALRQYCWIQQAFRQCDVRRDQQFQVRYNGFYRVRRNADWRKVYYDLMERAKSAELTFAEVLSSLKEQTGMLEASFASKLVATVDPNRPVVDQFVLRNFGLRLPYPYAPDRTSRTIRIYEELCRHYDELLNSPTGQMICGKFESRYPWAEITNLKKVDLVLWQTRRAD